MRIVAILQARMGSVRLPGKSLLPLCGVPMVQQIVERVQRTPSIARVVVAYPLTDSPAFQFLAETGCDLYAYPGDANDLVARYVHAAECFGAELVVRVPCDNPCVDPVYIEEAIASYLKDPFVYYSNTTAAVGPVWVDGIGAEVVSLSRLQWLDQRTTGHPDWREHPHRYFEDTGLLYRPEPQVKLDVNTALEYEGIRTLYAQFGHNRFTSQEVVSWLLPQGDPYEHL